MRAKNILLAARQHERSLCRKAAQLYKEAGRGSAAAEALSKAAKLVEDKNPQVHSYLQAPSNLLLSCTCTRLRHMVLAKNCMSALLAYSGEIDTCQ